MVIHHRLLFQKKLRRGHSILCHHHRAAEDFVNYFKHFYGMKTLILRLSNGYGYPMILMLTDGHWYLMTFAVRLLLLTSLFKSSGRQYRTLFLCIIRQGLCTIYLYAIDEWGEGLCLYGNCSMSILEVLIR